MENIKLVSIDAGKYATKSYALTPDGVIRKKCRTKVIIMGRWWRHR